MDSPSTELHAAAPQQVYRLLYSKKETCYLLSMSLRNLDYRIALGTVKFVKRGRSVLIPRSEVLRLAKGDHPEAMAVSKRPSASAGVFDGLARSAA
jgi:hypothetical protein